MIFKNALKMIPLKFILDLVWSILYPILIKKVGDSQSAIDDKILKELNDLFKELSK